MVSRVFAGFLVILTAGFLFLLPFTDALYDFRTDVKEDVLAVVTPSGNTTPTVVLNKSPYLDDTSTIKLASGLFSDAPVVSSYNGTTRALTMAGFTDNATRTLTVSYDTYALSGYSAINTITSRFDLFWLVGIIGFIISGIAVVLKGG